MIFEIKDAPKYEENSNEEVMEFIDIYINCKICSKTNKSYLCEIINKLQTHSKFRSKSCIWREKIHGFFFAKLIFQRTFIVNDRSKINETMVLIKKTISTIPTGLKM